MDKRIQIYLAGTIYVDGPAAVWKEELSKEFHGCNDIIFFDPDPINECNLAMVPRDKSVIDNSDVFVAYIEDYTAGTSMEIYHAYLKNDTPVIVICPNGLVDNDIWIKAHSHIICKGVHEAADYIKSIVF